MVVVVAAGWATVVSGVSPAPGTHAVAMMPNDAEGENDEEVSGVHVVKVAAS